MVLRGKWMDQEVLETMPTGLLMDREGNRVMKVCGFNSWIKDGFVYEMGRTDGEASLVRKKTSRVLS